MPPDPLEQWLSALATGQVPAATLSQLPQLDEYRLLQPLGRGAMGCVYAAHDTVLDRPVAIKLLSAMGASSRERFLVEARAIARLSHPNVVAIHRVGSIGDVPYLVSEYIRGEGLDRLPLPQPESEVLRIAIDLGRGLSAAHRRGVLHRDIKPANAMRTDEGTVKLLDFGLAKLSSESSELLPIPSMKVEAVEPLARTPLFESDEPARAAAANAAQDRRSSTTPQVPKMYLSGFSSGAAVDLTHAGAQMGTPLYMAPEMWRGEVATAQVDIYSLGALLFELVAGRPVHLAETLLELQTKVEAGEAPPLHSVAPKVSSRFAAIIDRCLCTDPQGRYASATALVDALLGRQAEMNAASATNVAAKGRSRRPLGFLGAGLCAAALAVTGFGWYARTRTEAKLPGGWFVMGSSDEEIKAAYTWANRLGYAFYKENRYLDREQPARRVYVSPFSIDLREITNAEYAAWMNQLIERQHIYLQSANSKAWLGGHVIFDWRPEIGASGIELSAGRFAVRQGMQRRPVNGVTWDGAAAYCAAHGKRLPTEAEWEYAARVSKNGQARQFPWGDNEPDCERAVVERGTGYRACTGRLPALPDVGSRSGDRTEAGIYDLGGSVAEWTADTFRERYPACDPECRDPLVREEGNANEKDRRVVRGSSWAMDFIATRATGRIGYPRYRTFSDLGFRCARSRK